MFSPSDRFLVRPLPFLPVSFSVLGVGFANVGVMRLDGSAIERFEVEEVLGQAVDCSISNSEFDSFEGEPKIHKRRGKGGVACGERVVVGGDIDNKAPIGEGFHSWSSSGLVAGGIREVTGHWHGSEGIG